MITPTRAHAIDASTEKNVQRGGIVAKKGMRRPDVTEAHGTESNKKLHLDKNEQKPVPEIKGAARSGKEKTRPM